MTRRRLTYFGAVAAAAIVAVVAGSALAAGNASSPTSFMQSLAKHLGISTEKLQDAAKAAAIDQIDAALADGKITKEQADAAKERIQSGDAPLLFFGPRFGDGGPASASGTARVRFRQRPGGFHDFGDLGAAAATTSTSPRLSCTSSCGVASRWRRSRRTRASRPTA